MGVLAGITFGPLTWIGLGLIVVVLMAITLDIIVIPTMITTIAALGIWLIFLAYAYRQNPSAAVFLGSVFLLIGFIYIFIITKFKLWKWMAHEKKAPQPLDNREQVISELNQGEVTAHTDLRPVGKIRAQGKILDGLSETGFIAGGSPLIITGYAEGQYKVRKK